MKVRVYLVDGRSHVGTMIRTEDTWVTIQNSRNKLQSFATHSVLMVEEI